MDIQKIKDQIKKQANPHWSTIKNLKKHRELFQQILGEDEYHNFLMNNWAAFGELEQLWVWIEAVERRDKQEIEAH